MKRKSLRRSLVKTGLISVNVLLLAMVSFFVLTARSANSAKASTPLHSVSTPTAVNPLDTVSSADIAVTVSRMAGLAESTAVTNQADSQDVALTSAPTTDNVVSKPQVTATSFKSNKDIQNYVVQPGDTVSAIAAKFSVTSDSIRWSNNITGEAVAAGSKLLLPPMGYSGIVYTVKPGDTIDGLASRYKADKTELTAANDAEISGIKPGELIIIPNGQVVAAAPVAKSYAVGYAWGTGAIYGSNGYDYGYCTWYVATRVSVPANWGNANTWDNLAPLSGWTVSSSPAGPGSIAQSDAGSLGHVAYVEAVSADGTMIKYSDMNGLAGWGRVGNSDWVPVSHFQHYIYR
jgi:surface antigen